MKNLIYCREIIAMFFGKNWRKKRILATLPFFVTTHHYVIFIHLIPYVFTRETYSITRSLLTQRVYLDVAPLAVFCHHPLLRYQIPRGTPSARALNIRGWEKIAIFDTNCLLSRTRPMVTIRPQAAAVSHRRLSKP